MILVGRFRFYDDAKHCSQGILTLGDFIIAVEVRQADDGSELRWHLCADYDPREDRRVRAFTRGFVQGLHIDSITKNSGVYCAVLAETVEATAA